MISSLAIAYISCLFMNLLTFLSMCILDTIRTFVNVQLNVRYFRKGFNVPDRPHVQLVVFAQRRDSCLLELHFVVCYQAVHVCRPQSTSQKSIGKSSGFKSQLMIGKSAIDPEGSQLQYSMIP
jgi:hypothetical protein